MNQIAPISTREVTFADKTGGAGLSPQNLGEVIRFAEVMAQGGIALPVHLRNEPGACMAVAMQALEWQMSPFAVASKSYAVKGVIAYEAQLIAAVVNTRSGIEGRLKYEFEGEGPTLQCTVTGKLEGEEYSYTSPRFDQITTKNSPLWKSDPQQQMGYFSARSWARRYTPEVMLGVYDRDEASTMTDITPTPSPAERLKQAQIGQETHQGGQEGFSTTHVQETINGDPETVSDDAVQATEQTAEADPPKPTAEGGAGDNASPSPELMEAVKKLFGFAQEADASSMEERPEYRGRFKELAPDYKSKVPEHEHDQLKAIINGADAVIKGDQDYDVAIQFFAQQIGFDPKTLELPE